MTHEGPLPDEALPAGEDALTLEELDRFASCLFELEEMTDEHFPNLIPQTNLTPERRKIFARMQDEAIDSLRQGIIDNRE